MYVGLFNKIKDEKQGGCVVLTDNTEGTVLSLYASERVHLYHLWLVWHCICVHSGIEADLVSICWLSCVISIDTKGSWQHRTETI